MAEYVVKISLPGKGIESTEPRDFVLNSDYGTVKIYKEPANKAYETIVVLAGENATVSIEHRLPFIPLVLLFTELKPGSGHWYLGAMTEADPTDKSGAVSIDWYDSYIDDTYIKIKYINSTGGNLTIKYYYFIFADNG